MDKYRELGLLGELGSQGDIWSYGPPGSDQGDYDSDDCDSDDRDSGDDLDVLYGDYSDCSLCEHYVSACIDCVHADDDIYINVGDGNWKPWPFGYCVMYNLSLVPVIDRY